MNHPLSSIQIMEYTKFFDALNFADSATRCALCFALFGILFWISLRTMKLSSPKRPPGPIGLPIVGYVPFLGKEPHKTLWKLRETYGDIMGLYLGSQYVVVLSEYNVAKEVLSHPAALERPNLLFKHIPHVGFGAQNGEAWTEQRKFCRFATRYQQLGENFWENIIMEEVTAFVNEIRAKGGEAVDISRSLSASVISNILSILIGRRLKKEEEAEKIKLVVEYSEVVLTATDVSKAVTVIPGLRKFCELFGIGEHRRIFNCIQKFVNFIRDEINLHKNSTSLKNVDDFMNIYLNKLTELKEAGNKKHYFSEDMLEGNVNGLFLGASDSIISSLRWLLRLMAKHRDVQEKVYAELMEAVGYDGRARYGERHNIPYTFAVLMEAQRVSSILALNSTRGVTRDIHIRGYTIPKNSHVTANFWGLHHDPNYWENPEEFRPERFLMENGSKLIAHAQSYLPFSIGRRNCPGEIIAWIEILFYFSEILKNFEISKVPGEELKFDVTLGLVSHLVHQRLCFKERKSNNLTSL